MMQPRAKGCVRLKSTLRAGRSVIENLHQSGSLKVLFPRTQAAALQAVNVNTAGGVTGGDCFSIHAAAGRGSELTLSTQAAERAYRAQPKEVGQITNQLVIEQSARVNWLPQETILFEHSALNRSLHIQMKPKARLLLVEPLIFGRTACAETLNTLHFKDRIEVWRGCAPHFIDATHLRGDVQNHLTCRSIASGARAMALILYIAPDARAHLAAIRALLPASAGASLIHEDTLIMRALAVDGFELRRFLIPILNRLSGAPLPRAWMI